MAYKMLNKIINFIVIIILPLFIVLMVLAYLHSTSSVYSIIACYIVLIAIYLLWILFFKNHVKSPEKKFYISILMFFLILTPLIDLFALPYNYHFIRAPDMGKLYACEANLKGIDLAIEMYSKDNGGKYPSVIAALVPKYLKEIPLCPAAKGNMTTYYLKSIDNESYVIYCAGRQHKKAGLPRNAPLFFHGNGVLSNDFFNKE